MKTYGFVFARGGSKGLPKKNIKLLNGKPLIQYSIEVAKTCSVIDKVFVSTEDANISEVARRCGCTVIPRPVSLALDDTPEWLAWRHAIEWVTNNEGMFDCFVSLPPTSPLRNEQDVEAIVEKLITSGADACISTTEANRSPFFNMVKLNANDRVELVCQTEASINRRQEAPEVFDITTVAYATTPSFVMSKDRIFDGNVAATFVPKERAVDIDDIYDFMLAEAIIRSQSQ